MYISDIFIFIRLMESTRDRGTKIKKIMDIIVSSPRFTRLKTLPVGSEVKRSVMSKQERR